MIEKLFGVIVDYMKKDRGTQPNDFQKKLHKNHLVFCQQFFGGRMLVSVSLSSVLNMAPSSILQKAFELETHVASLKVLEPKGSLVLSSQFC